MQLPNKLYSYKNSTLSLLPLVLGELKKGAIRADDLYQTIRPHLAEPTDFLTVMDCAYMLGAVDINDNGEVFLCLLK